MTEQEAIKVLETQPFYECIELCVPNSLTQCNACENRVALDMAIDALEKQIPKKPQRKQIMLGDTKIPATVCPSCNHAFGAMTQWCSGCGQKLDWSDRK